MDGGSTKANSAGSSPAAGTVFVAVRPAQQGDTVTAMAGTGGGTLSVRNNCLVTVSAGVVSLPVFREGAAEWDAEAQTLRFANKTYRMGDSIQWGGGSLPKAVAAESEFADRAAACGARDIFMVG